MLELTSTDFQAKTFKINENTIKMSKTVMISGIIWFYYVEVAEMLKKSSAKFPIVLFFEVYFRPVSLIF